MLTHHPLNKHKLFARYYHSRRRRWVAHAHILEYRTAFLLFRKAQRAKTQAETGRSVQLFSSRSERDHHQNPWMDAGLPRRQRKLMLPRRSSSSTSTPRRAAESGPCPFGTLPRHLLRSVEWETVEIHTRICRKKKILVLTKPFISTN